MDTLTYYRNTVQKTIKKYYNLTNSQPANTTETTISDGVPPSVADRLILDEQRDQYLWLRCGWDGKKRVQYIILYFQIQNGKIWVEEDNTDRVSASQMLLTSGFRSIIILGQTGSKNCQHVIMVLQYLLV
jgi:XisI protein